MTNLYINSEHCLNINQLKQYFHNLLEDSDIYLDLLDYAKSGDLAKWLKEHNENLLALKVNDVDNSIGDSEYMNILSEIFGSTFSFDKPHYSKFFAINKATYKQKNNKVVVSLVIKILENVNENYTIKIISTSGYDEFRINTSKIEHSTLVKHISFTNNINSFSGNITIDDEKVFDNISLEDDEKRNYDYLKPNSDIHIKKKERMIDNENGFVDLGLSVLWASCNIGASSPEERGNYYRYYNANEKIEKDCQLPSIDNFREFQQCKIETDLLKGKKVLKVTGLNGNKIYFPFDYAGDAHYLSRTMEYGNIMCFTTKCTLIPKSYTSFSFVRLVKKR